MKRINLILILIIFQSCSFNNDSTYWNEHNIKKIKKEKNLVKIIEKSKDITLMSLNEYKIYIDEHIKKSNYPDIAQ
tara:strand:- start:1388 stop:1615 length:228 start_codon:yes stop_codon:yes gene_type:complete